MGKAGKREYVQVLRLVETFDLEVLHGAVKDALRLGAIGYDAVKHLVLCRIERRPPKLDLDIHPYLPRANVATMTDAEWAHIEPLIPPGKPGGGKRRVAIREVINGVMYILSTGCQWRALPKDLPPRSTVHDYLGLWNWDGTLDRIHHALYLKCREKAAREASPTACIIDSQSVKSAEKGGLASTATASMPAS